MKVNPRSPQGYKTNLFVCVCRGLWVFTEITDCHKDMSTFPSLPCFNKAVLPICISQGPACVFTWILAERG